MGEVTSLPPARGGVRLWDPGRYPRNTRGSLYETVSAAERDTVRFPDGTTIRQRADGGWAVASSGKIVRHESIESAVGDALDRSARKKDATSVGGETAYRSFEEALRDPESPFTEGTSSSDDDETPEFAAAFARRENVGMQIAALLRERPFPGSRSQLGDGLRDVLRYEALGDPSALRASLVDVAVIAGAWAAALDARIPPEPPRRTRRSA